MLSTNVVVAGEVFPAYFWLVYVVTLLPACCVLIVAALIVRRRRG